MPAIRFSAWNATLILLLGVAAGCSGDSPSDTADDTGTAPTPWACGDDVGDARDGASYRSVVIGDQCWLRDNLNLGTMIESTQAGSQAHDDGQIEKYCWDNDQAGCDGTGDVKRGGFYEWAEALQDYSGQPTDPAQGLCPDGFHLPSVAEWDVLVDLFGGVSDAPSHLAEGNDSGFDAVMTGYRCTMSGGFRVSAMSSSTMAYFWTTEASSGTYAWLWEFGENLMQTFAFERSLGLSVRCVGDEAPSGS
jgi:uncharacterized protein (TIGR02145 family)